MTSPGHGFRAHDCSFSRTSDSHELLQAFRKFWRRHVIRIPSEGSIPPTEVDGIFFAMTKTAELFDVFIADIDFAERFLKRIRIELGTVTRLRNRSYVDDFYDALMFQQRNEFVNRVGRMADCMNWVDHHAITLPQCRVARVVNRKKILMGPFTLKSADGLS